MLTETIQRSIDAIKEQRRMMERKATSEQFSAALGELNKAAIQTQKTLDCADEVKACHISQVPVLTSTVRDKLLEDVNNCGKAIHERALNADKIGLLKSSAKAAQKELDDAWKQCASNLIEPLKGRLSILRDLSEDGMRIQKLDVNMRKARESPVERERIRSFAKDIQEATRIVNSFPLDSNIENFLRKVSRRNATLADLTPEILAWLCEYHFQNKFLIVSS